MSQENDPKQNKIDTKITAILVLMVIGVIIAQFVSFDAFVQPPPLLPETPALERVTSEEEIAETSHLPFYIPEDKLGADGVGYGIFTQPYKNFPRGASLAVYAKNNWRVFQIEQYPNQTVTSLTERISHDQKNDLQMTSGPAALLNLPIADKCFEPTESQAGSCLVDRVLLVQKPGMVVAISTGNSNITDGQLITLGRSLKKIHQ